MNNENIKTIKYCPKCGSRIEGEVSFCKICGFSLTLKNEGRNTRNFKKALSKIISVVVISIAVIGAVALGNIGESISEKFLDFVINRKVDTTLNKEYDDYVENLISESEENFGKYTAGYYDDKRYVSEHFNLAFEATNGWYMYSKEELAPIAEYYENQVRTSMVTTIEKNSKEMDILGELKEKWVNSIHVKTEMGAAYVSDDIVVGAVSVNVLSSPGADTIITGDYVKEIKSMTEELYDNVEVNKIVLADQSFDAIEARIEAEGGVFKNRMLITIKDGVVCYIICESVEEYESEVFESMLKQFYVYK